MYEYLISWLSEPVNYKVTTALASLLLVIVISRFIKNSIRQYVHNGDIRYRLGKFITFISYVLIILVLTVIFSDRLGNLTVAMGVAGAGVAFALQEVIASFAGWFAITFAGFYKPGDRLQLGGIKGDVIDISFLRTTLMELGEWVKSDNYSGRVVRVANSFVFKEPVFNYSGEFPFLWDEIIIPVRYGSDHHLARRILEDTATKTIGDYTKKANLSWEDFSKQFLLENAPLEPLVTLALNDNWMEFTLRYVVNYKVRRRTKDILFTRILEEFGKTEGKVEIASTTVQIIDVPPVNFRLERKKASSDVPFQG